MSANQKAPNRNKFTQKELAAVDFVLEAYRARGVDVSGSLPLPDENVVRGFNMRAGNTAPEAMRVARQVHALVKQRIKPVEQAAQQKMLERAQKMSDDGVREVYLQASQKMSGTSLSAAAMSSAARQPQPQPQAKSKPQPQPVPQPQPHTTKRGHEELLSEVERLRAENASLKKRRTVPPLDDVIASVKASCGLSGTEARLALWGFAAGATSSLPLDAAAVPRHAHDAVPYRLLAPKTPDPSAPVSLARAVLFSGTTLKNVDETARIEHMLARRSAYAELGVPSITVVVLRNYTRQRGFAALVLDEQHDEGFTERGRAKARMYGSDAALFGERPGAPVNVNAFVPYQAGLNRFLFRLMTRNAEPDMCYDEACFIQVSNTAAAARPVTELVAGIDKQLAGALGALQFDSITGTALEL